MEKSELITKLKEQHCFWSYDPNSINDVPDDMLIEKTLIYLDLPEIDALFTLFPYQKIKEVWLEHLIPQCEYLYTLNRFLAWYYFHAKNPDSYIKSMTTRYFNKLSVEYKNHAFPKVVIKKSIHFESIQPLCLKLRARADDHDPHLLKSKNIMAILTRNRKIIH